MHKFSAKFEHEVGSRKYVFFCDMDAPLGEAFDALTKFRADIADMINKTLEAEKKAQEAKDQKSTEGAPQ